MDDLFEVSLHQLQLIAIGPNTIRRAEREIVSCEHCHPHDSEIPFDWLLAEVTDKRGLHEFILSELARCPNCKHAVTEKMWSIGAIEFLKMRSLFFIVIILSLILLQSNCRRENGDRSERT